MGIFLVYFFVLLFYIYKLRKSENYELLFAERDLHLVAQIFKNIKYVIEEDCIVLNCIHNIQIIALKMGGQHDKEY